MTPNGEAMICPECGSSECMFAPQEDERDAELASLRAELAQVKRERDALREALILYAKDCDNCGGNGFTYWYPYPDRTPTKKPCPYAACAALAVGRGEEG